MCRTLWPTGRPLAASLRGEAPTDRIVNPALRDMLEADQPKTPADYQNAAREVVQEIALLGLWRGGFFEHTAFYGGTALRIFHGLRRFSEDLDFTLLDGDNDSRLERYLPGVATELESWDLPSRPNQVAGFRHGHRVRLPQGEHVAEPPAHRRPVRPRQAPAVESEAADQAGNGPPASVIRDHRGAHPTPAESLSGAALRSGQPVCRQAARVALPRMEGAGQGTRLL